MEDQMRKRITMFIAAAGLALGGFAVAGPAQEAEAKAGNGCAGGYACLFRDSKFQVRKAQFAYCIDDLRNYSGANDSATSVWNAGNLDTLYVYINSKGKNPTGVKDLSFPINKGSDRLPANWNDKITSVYFSSQRKNIGTTTCK
jgi:hypothetical protein